MTDDEIIKLFKARDETALKRTQEKYGAYCMAVARSILGSPRDVEECVNDALYKAWNAIPPAEPKDLKAFLGRITRNAALDMHDHISAEKRGGGQVELALSEIEEFISDDSDVEKIVESHDIADIINRFLALVPKQQRVIFLRRYLYFNSVGEIAGDLGISESKVKSVLFRLRKKLKAKLEKEGVL